MPGHAWPHSCKITSSICSFNRYVPACNKWTYTSNSSQKLLMFKNPGIWLAKNVFAFNSRTRFFPDMRFCQNHKGHYGAWFKPKKSTYQWTISFVKSKKSYFGGVLGHYPQSEIFSQKSGCASFLHLRHPHFMRSFRKILWGILKTCLPTDIVT